MINTKFRNHRLFGCAVIAALLSPTQLLALSRDEVTNSVDVVFMFTTERRNNYGGVSQTFANMRQSLGITNRAHDNSGTGVQFSYIAFPSPTGYVASSSNNNIVGDLRSGRVQGAFNRRDRTGCDVMAINGQMRAAGLAFVGDPRQYAVKFLTGSASAHEIGHTFGCGHGGVGSGFESGGGDRGYAGGWAFREGSRRAGTIMTGAQIMWYSTPNRTFEGRRTGIANVKDNTRRIRETRNESSRIRTLRPEGGRGGGWWHVRNRFSNLQMGLKSNNRNNGTRLAQKSDRNPFGQWRFDSANEGGGWLTTRNRGSGKAMDMTGRSAPGRPIVQQTHRTSNRNQHFKFDHSDNGLVRLRFRIGNRVVHNNARKTNSGNELRQGPILASHSQWYLERRNE